MILVDGVFTGMFPSVPNDLKRMENSIQLLIAENVICMAKVLLAPFTSHLFIETNVGEKISQKQAELTLVIWGCAYLHPNNANEANYLEIALLMNILS